MDITLHIEGMTCQHCVNSIENALKAVNGVEEVKVDLMAKIARIKAVTDKKELVEAIENIGFSVK